MSSFFKFVSIVVFTLLFSGTFQQEVKAQDVPNQPVLEVLSISPDGNWEIIPSTLENGEMEIVRKGEDSGECITCYFNDLGIALIWAAWMQDSKLVMLFGNQLQMYDPEQTNTSSKWHGVSGNASYPTIDAENNHVMWTDLDDGMIYASDFSIRKIQLTYNNQYQDDGEYCVGASFMPGLNFPAYNFLCADHTPQADESVTWTLANRFGKWGEDGFTIVAAMSAPIIQCTGKLEQIEMDSEKLLELWDMNMTAYKACEVYNLVPEDNSDL